MENEENEVVEEVEATETVENTEVVETPEVDATETQNEEPAEQAAPEAPKKEEAKSVEGEKKSIGGLICLFIILGLSVIFIFVLIASGIWGKTEEELDKIENSKADIEIQQML